MCGITGIFSLQLNREEHRGTLEKMLPTLSHRGPEGWGVYLGDAVSLGQCRLSILDLARGTQPMISDRFSLVYNGEIFNYLELRQELEAAGHRFQTNCDTEVVLRAFEQHGHTALSLFNGQFALALWDKKEGRLLLARDRYGIRPLFLLRHRGGFYFSSEFKAFDRIPGYRREFQPEHLFEHGLFWNTLADHTVYRDITSVEPGTGELLSADGKRECFRYYQLGESGGNSPADFSAAAEEFEALLNAAVRLRLRSDVPVANYLSGGIDSSVISHLTAVNQKNRFKTYSIAFAQSQYDESEYQQQMVRRLGSEHHELRISYEMIAGNFLETVYHCEQPLFRTAPVPLFLLSGRVHADGIKVVLTGEAADEILYGYDSYKELKLLELWRRDPASPEIDRLIAGLYPHLDHYKDRTRFGLIKMYYEDFLASFDPVLASLNIRVKNNQVLASYLNRDYGITYNRERVIEGVRRMLPENFFTWSSLQQNQFLEMKTLLPGYLLSSQGDRMSLAHSVEGRYPFLDHRLVEKLFYYNDDFKLSGLSQKHLLRRVFRDRIPAGIINRPKQPYMAPDLKSFFADGVLAEPAREFLAPAKIRDYGIFDADHVSRLLKKFSRRMPEQIGYRDNMLFTFILSTQIADYWARHPRQPGLDEKLKREEILDYSRA